MSDWRLGLADYIDRYLHRCSCSSVLQPVRGVPVLGPADSRPIVCSDAIPMVGNGSFQDVNDAWPVLVVVNRAEDAARRNVHHSHSKLAPSHSLDFRAKVHRRK